MTTTQGREYHQPYTRQKSALDPNTTSTTRLVWKFYPKKKSTQYHQYMLSVIIKPPNMDTSLIDMFQSQYQYNNTSTTLVLAKTIIN